VYLNRELKRLSLPRLGASFTCSVPWLPYSPEAPCRATSVRLVILYHVDRPSTDIVLSNTRVIEQGRGSAYLYKGLKHIQEEGLVLYFLYFY
jgi:hypothetical protein